ncbi:MAG: hypothetical protein COB93_03380 [Sneathiella sp.]|nr:MAG: hypothetical protein COB93_03380 [Sneathiella sp.]
MKKLLYISVAIAAPFALLASCAEDKDYLQSGISAYEPEDCAPVVEQHLDRLAFKKEGISKIEYLTSRISEGPAGEEYNYEAWLSFKNCTGNYAIVMNRFCQISNSYTTGNCELGSLTEPKS